MKDFLESLLVTGAAAVLIGALFFSGMWRYVVISIVLALGAWAWDRSSRRRMGK